MTKWRRPISCKDIWTPAVIRRNELDRITFTDENGNEVELEILSMAQYEGQTYILVTDEQAEEKEEINVFIMR